MPSKEDLVKWFLFLKKYILTPVSHGSFCVPQAYITALPKKNLVVNTLGREVTQKLIISSSHLTEMNGFKWRFEKKKPPPP